MELNIYDLRKLCKPANIEITLHAAKRLEQRHISIKDVISTILSGEIIEQYPTDYPYPSCLILGLSVQKTSLHIVVGSNMEKLWIVTAYYPSLEQWEDNLKIRKGK